MFFHRKYLTTAGKSLIDSAIAGSTITWTRCATSALSFSTDLHSDLDLVHALTDIKPSSGSYAGKYTGSGNTITATKQSHTDSNTYCDVAITCTVSNPNQANVVSGPANTFGVWASTDNGSTETLVAVAFWDSSDGAADTIPPSGTLFEASVEMLIKTSDEAISTVKSDPTWLTPITEFTKLKNRVVTTHSENSTTSGETQDIYGVKTFKNNTKHSGDVLPTGSNSLGSSSSKWNSLFATNVGTSSAHVTTAYIDNINIGSTSQTLSNYIKGVTVTNATNAVSTTKLSTARSISGIKFDGSSDVIYYGECNTGASTQIKDVTIPNFELVKGATVIVKFTHRHVSPGALIRAKLRINTSDDVIDGDEKYILFQGSSCTGASYYSTWQNGDTVKLVYDGENWVCLGYPTYVQNAFCLTNGSDVTKLSPQYNGLISYDSIIPSANSTSSSTGYSLGSSSKKWNTLYTRKIEVPNGSSDDPMSFITEFDSDNVKQVNFTNGSYGLGIDYQLGDDANRYTFVVPYDDTSLCIGGWNSSQKVHAVYAKNVFTDYLSASNIDSLIDHRIAELFSTTTPINAERLVYIDAFNDSTTFYDAFADVGTQTNAYGQLDLEYRSRYGTSIVGIGEYLSGKQLRLTDGSSATGTWEVIHTLSLPVTTATGLRRYFIAKRIA